MQLHANQTIVILWQLSHTMLQHENMVRLDKKNKPLQESYSTAMGACSQYGDIANEK